MHNEIELELEKVMKGIIDKLKKRLSKKISYVNKGKRTEEVLDAI